MTDEGMEPQVTALLTIGAFARTSRLSIKALRLYDESGLLPPVCIDPETGYRYYDPAQLERARLVVWLRRLDMPLARIRLVCDLCETDRAAAVAEIREFWMRIEADTAARRDLVDFLIDQLSRKEATMNHTERASRPSRSNGQNQGEHEQRLELRYAALSDVGSVRDVNQDTAFAGDRLLAVADGFGDQGAPASAAAIDALRDVGGHVVESGDLLNVLRDAAGRAHEAVAGVGGQQTGSTLTAMLWTGSQLGLVHIGDSRAYLLRDDRFFQITHDHTLVQSMIDDGRITPQEAESHPQRSLLVQALGTSAPVPDPQLHVADVQPGDRYLLCTDGLSANVPDAEIRRILQTTPDDPSGAVSALIDLSNRAGGADNVACVVADLVSAE